MKLVIQIPCYNEEKTLPVTIEALPKHIDGIDEIEVLIINDGSTDKTVEVAKSLGIKNIVEMQHNSGLARAFKSGIQTSLNLDADIIVNTDADNQYNANDIEKLINPILSGDADIVIGARPVEKIKHFSLLKKFLQKLGSKVMSIISSVNIPDAPSGFRAFSRNAALQINIFDNYTYTLETIIQAKAKDLTVVSVPIDVNEDLRESRLVKNNFDYIRKSLFTMIRMFLIYRPFRFFMVIASVFLLLGLLPGGRFLYYFYTSGSNGHVQSLILSAILLLAGIQFVVIAAVSELFSINRKMLEDIQRRIKLQGLKK